MIQEIMKSLDERMEKALANVKREFSTIRAGRASVSMLDRVQVEYYGSMMPINQLANVSTPEPRQLVITPWDKGSLAAIERAITKSDIGITPSNDGNIIRLTIPQLTEQRRKDLAKQVKGLAEDGRVAVRNIRRDVNDSLKKLEKEVSEDEIRREQDKVQAATDRYIAEIDKLLSAKEAEILEV
jgi:ribosome recycling factor